MALSLSPALGPLIGGFLEVWFGWESAFLFQFCYGALMLWLAYARLRETLPEKDPMAMDPIRLVRNYGGLLRNRHYVGHLAPAVFGFGGLFAYVATTPFLFIDRLGLSPEVFGMLSIFSVSGFALGSWLAGRLQGKMADWVVIRLGLASQALGAVLMAALSIELTLTHVIGPMILFVFGFGLLMPASSSRALHPFPRIAGSASAMMGFLQIAVGAAGSFLLSVLYDGSALMLGLTMIGLAALGSTGYLALASRDEPEADEA
jgi:DHA1 family bicyclomycin/chloramphenicol resistance-like MFS transporter